MSEQYVAVASQNLTCPIVTASDPAFTVSVSVTTLPLSTSATVLIADVTARVVVVAAGAALPGRAPPKKTTIRVAEINSGQVAAAFKDDLASYANMHPSALTTWQSESALMVLSLAII
jgi:hypothetical protein